MECNVWKSPTDGYSWYLRLTWSVCGGQHPWCCDLGCDRRNRKKKPVKIYFMLVQGWVFHSPLLLQTYFREAQQISKLQDTGVWRSQPTTWNHLCIPINASVCLRHIKGFVSSLKAQRRLTTTLGNTFPHLSDSGTFHACGISSTNANVTAHSALQIVFICTSTRVNNHQQ